MPVAVLDGALKPKLRNVCSRPVATASSILARVLCHERGAAYVGVNGLRIGWPTC
jgi:hypothetical protein